MKEEKLYEALYNDLTKKFNDLHNGKYPALSRETVKEIYLTAFKDALDLANLSPDSFTLLQDIRPGAKRKTSYASAFRAWRPAMTDSAHDDRQTGTMTREQYEKFKTDLIKEVTEP